MAADAHAPRRNIFEAFLTLIKTDKVDEDSIGTSGKLTTTSASKSVNAIANGYPSPSPWIKPECPDVLHDYQPSSTNSTKSSTGPVVSSSPTVTTAPSSLLSSEPASQPPRLPTPVCDTIPIAQAPVAPVASSLQIASVSNLPTLSTTFSLATSAQLPSAPKCGNSSVRISCASPSTSSSEPQTVVSSSSFTSPTDDNRVTPVEDLHTQASRLTLSFGCLDDLLPQNDPTRSAYIQYKCSQLRYPLPLAVAMSKICDPFKLRAVPVKFSDSSAAPVRRKSFTKYRRPDQGYLEIDSSHFSVTTGSTVVPPETDTPAQPVSNRPRTKAQLRSMRKSAGPSDDSYEDRLLGHESSDLPRKVLATPCEKRISSFQNGIKSREHRRSTGTISSVLSPSSQPAQAISEDGKLPPISTPSCKVRTVRRSHQRTPVIVIEDDDEDLEALIHSGSTEAVQPPSSNRMSSGRVFPCKLSMTRSKNCSPEVSILSSQQLYQITGSNLPYWIHLKFPGDSRPRPTNYLLLGDVARIICLLMTDPNNASCLEPVLKHCCRTCHAVSCDYLKMRIPSAFLNVGSIVRSKFPSGLPVGHPVWKLPVVPWPNVHPYAEAFGLAWRKLPSGRRWTDAVVRSLLVKTATLIMQTEPSRIGANSVDNRTKLSTNTISSDSVCSTPMVTSSITAPKTKSQNTAAVSCISSHIPPSIEDQFMLHRNLSTRQYLGMEQLVECFKLITLRMFIDIKATFEGWAVDQPSDKRADLKANLFTCLFDVHSSVSVCLRCLRDSYASLISAGACLTARLKLSGLYDTDTDQLRIERGRARLFPNEEVARHSIIRILCEEIHPQLFNLVDQIRAAHLTLQQLCGNVCLLGPFLPQNTLFSGPAAVRNMIVEALSGTIPGVLLSTPGWDNFHQLLQQIYELLKDIVATFTRQLCTKLSEFLSKLSASCRSISQSWIPAFSRTNRLIDVRASEDLKFLAVSLQNQYDMLEAWLRAQHNIILPEIGSRVMELFHKLFKPGDGIVSKEDWLLPTTRLFVPYGSKNPTEFSTIKDLDSPFVKLPPWPPLITLPSEQPVIKNSSVPSISPKLLKVLLATPTSHEPESIQPVQFSTTVCATEPAPCVFVASVSSPRPSVPCVHESSSMNAKRVCIDLSQNASDGSTTIRSYNTDTDEEDCFECVGTSTIDRRRLGQLKRKIKISHAATSQSTTARPIESDKSESEVSVHESVNDDLSGCDEAIHSVPSEHATVETSNGASEVQCDSVLGVDTINKEPVISVSDPVNLSAGTDFSTDQTEDDPQRPAFNNNDDVSQNLPITEVAKTTALVVDTAVVSITSSPSSMPLVNTTPNIQELYGASHSAPIFSNSWSETSALLPNKRSSSPTPDPPPLQAPTSGCLDISQVAANLDRLAPWLEQKAHAPGPVTAAILSQSGSPPSPDCALAIDLTSDD